MLNFKKYLLIIALISFINLTPFNVVGSPLVTEQKFSNQKPQYLYKVISMEDWKRSQSQLYVVLSKEDTEFIRLRCIYIFMKFTMAVKLSG